MTTISKGWRDCGTTLATTNNQNALNRYLRARLKKIICVNYLYVTMLGENLLLIVYHQHPNPLTPVEK